MSARAFLLVCAAAAGCLSPYGGEDVGSGIFGIAMLGPTCPVVQEPPRPECDDRPYEGPLRAARDDGGVGGVFSTDAQGRFNVSLPPGAYSIRSPEENRLPTCANVAPIVVPVGGWVRVDVSCDTGIR